MKALILNSGVGKRMGKLTDSYPKCMTSLICGDTILSRQLKILENVGVKDVIITTGPFEVMLINYVYSLKLNLNYKFVNNQLYQKTNYIYSIYLAKEHLDDSMIVLHGDLVFEETILKDILLLEGSFVTVSSLLPLPEKDFKAVIKNGQVKKIGVQYFEDAYTAQPFYKFEKADWIKWLEMINYFCINDNTNVYAEEAFNEIADTLSLYPFDYEDRLCNEIDTPDDLILVRTKLEETNLRKDQI